MLATTGTAYAHGQQQEEQQAVELIAAWPRPPFPQASSSAAPCTPPAPSSGARNGQAPSGEGVGASRPLT